MAPSVADLKQKLKAMGMSQGGDRGTLQFRIKMGEASISGKLVSPDGDPVHTLKLAKVKKLAATAGISPIGTLDEILSAYIEHLASNSTTSNDSGGEPTADAATTKTVAGSVQENAKALSAKVVELAEMDDFCGILNLAGAGGLTMDSSHALMRKSYLKLSLVLHPDKNRKAPDATKVFQALVNAFERCTQPELVEDVETKKGKKTAAKVSRSNEGCKRTKVCCPRCKQPWSASSVEGNPPYYYNFMMTGLQSFNCATCLLEFGCMSALHFCPFCDGSFEYHPNDYHRKIKCGRKNCRTHTANKTFGFMMFHASERTMKNTKIEVKRVREQRMKVTEQKRRRAQSFANRRGKASSKNVEAEQEAAFLLGLADECPRCGMSLADIGDDDDQNSHLRDCDDTDGKVTAHKRRTEAAAATQAAKRQKQVVQDDVASKAAFDLLGGSSENLWMLTDGAVQKECKDRGVDANGKSKDELIAALASSSSSQSNNLLTDGRSSSSKNNKSSKSLKVTVDSLPSNLHSMSLPQLRAVAASHGIVVDSSCCPSDIIELLEKCLAASSGAGSPLMITSGEKKPKRKPRKPVILSDDSSDSDYEED